MSQPAYLDNECISGKAPYAQPDYSYVCGIIRRPSLQHHSTTTMHQAHCRMTCFFKTALSTQCNRAAASKNSQIKHVWCCPAISCSFSSMVRLMLRRGSCFLAHGCSASHDRFRVCYSQEGSFQMCMLSCACLYHSCVHAIWVWHEASRSSAASTCGVHLLAFCCKSKYRLRPCLHLSECHPSSLPSSLLVCLSDLVGFAHTIAFMHRQFALPHASTGRF